MKKRPKKTGWRLRLARLHWPRWLAPYRRHIYLGLALAAVTTLGTLAYLYLSYGRIIDARLHGERDRAVPRGSRRCRPGGKPWIGSRSTRRC